MILEAKAAPAKEPLIPTYAGGQMPLSTFLADAVRHLLEDPTEWQALSKDMREWLELQQKFSILPGRDTFLIEASPPEIVLHRVLHVRRPPRQPDARHAAQPPDGAV